MKSSVTKVLTFVWFICLISFFVIYQSNNAKKTKNEFIQSKQIEVNIIKENNLDVKAVVDSQPFTNREIKDIEFILSSSKSAIMFDEVFVDRDTKSISGSASLSKLIKDLKK